MQTNATGLLIRTRRRELGVSQQALCAIAGVSIHTLSDLESGKANPTLGVLQAVLEPLGLELHIRIRAQL